MAVERGYDLVLIAPNSNPPVCKIMDYGKYKFEMAKREKEAKKKQHVVNLKEIRISPNIDTHDLNTKVNHTIKFLQHGDKVKITVRFRGRQVTHKELGRELLDRFFDLISEHAKLEKEAKLEGRNLSMFVAPK